MTDCEPVAFPLSEKCAGQVVACTVMAQEKGQWLTLGPTSGWDVREIQRDVLRRLGIGERNLTTHVDRIGVKATETTLTSELMLCLSRYYKEAVWCSPPAMEC